MTKHFDQLYKKIIQEATDDSDLPEFGQDQNSQQQAPEGDPSQTDQSVDAGLDDELAGLEKPVPPEELELAKLAVRARNFNIHSKDVNQYKADVNGQILAFEKLPDYFEKSKDWKTTLKFIEWIMNKYEGDNTSWSNHKELAGRDIITRIRKINRQNKGNPDMLLDNSKRLVWTRIILNAMLHADPSFNLVGTDVTEENMPDIFNMLKQNFNNNSRGLFNTELKGPNNN